MPRMGPQRFVPTALLIATCFSGTAAADEHLLDNGMSVVTLDGAGGLLALRCRATGDGVVHPDRARPLVAIEFKKPGEAVWVRVSPETTTRIVGRAGRQPDQWLRRPEKPTPRPVEPERVTVEGNRLEAVYVFAVEGVGRARVSYVIEPAPDGLWRFAARVKHIEGPADVVGVAFPIFEHVRIGASGLDDHQLRLQSFGHHTVHPGRQPIRDARYLGGAVLPWTEVYDGRTGFYVCAEDPTATNVEFTSQRGGPAAEHFAMATTKRDMIKPGIERTFEYAVAAHPGDWHWGADRYRAWFYRTHGKASYPKWMRTCDGWIDLQAENYGRDFRFSHLPDWLTRARAAGLNWVQVWGQPSHDGGTCCAAAYPPSPLYGGEKGWRDACRAIAARGGHVGGYFIYDRIDLLPVMTASFLGHFKVSDYPADTQWPTTEFIDRSRFVSDPSGVVPPWPPKEAEIAGWRKKVAEHERLYAAGKRAPSVKWWTRTYIDDPEWRAYLRSWIVDTYLKGYGSNTAYIDVLGCGSVTESYDPRRGHNGEGGYSRGKWRLAKHVVEAAREHDPDFALTMEGLGDLPGLYAAPMCSGVYRGGRNVYRYTFPERILIHGMANSGPKTSPVDQFLETFLEGMRYDVVGPPRAFPVYLMQLQRQFTPWLYEAVFRDTVGVSAADPRIQVRRHDTGRGILLTVVNRDRLEGQSVTIDPSVGRVSPAAFYTGICGAAGRLKMTRTKTGRRIAVPADTAAVMFVPNETPGDTPVWPVFRLRRTDPPAAEVTLFNLAGRRVIGQCRIETPGLTEPFEDRIDEARRALPLRRTAAPVDLKPWEAETVAFPITSVRDHRWTVRVRVTVDLGEAGTVTRNFLALPLALDGSFEVWGHASDDAPDGKRALVLPPSDSGYQHRVVHLWLEPARRYRLTVRAKRTGFTYRVGGALLWVQNDTTNTVWQHRGLDRKRPNAYQALTWEFDTPPELTRADLYLYNVISPDTAWFDDVRVEEVERK